MRVLQQLIEDGGGEFPRATPILKNHIYVDDVLFGDDEVEPLRQTRDQLNALLARGGFELRKWASNSPRLLADLDSQNHGLACSQIPSPDDRLKILGVQWNPAHDTFQFKVTLDASVPNTKRAILSTIARLYDPLGWVTPVTVSATILIQQLWSCAVKWDDAVPHSLLSRWTEIYTRLSALSDIQIPRWTSLTASAPCAEIHGFSDASSHAYAAAVYLRVTNSSGNVSTSLLAGKSRVAPLKLLSIPRLELAVAVLLARLVSFVREAIDISQFPIFCWSDSTIVLAWLRLPPSRWKTFVANRVAEVQSRLPDVTWRYVPTECNPADCASRGTLGDEVQAHSLWWRGPPWLRDPHDSWPSNISEVSDPAMLEEKIIALNSIEVASADDLASRYSSWPKLLRVTSYIFRFLNWRRKPHREKSHGRQSSSAVTSCEYSAAKLFWIKYMQAQVFSSELAALSAKRPLSGKSSIAALAPFLDENGILRVGGRLRHAPLAFSRKHPILLASQPLVYLIVANAHERSLHAGLLLTLSTVRREYWITRARTIVKQVLHRCVPCTRERAAVPSQLMGDLPAVRLTVPARCFSHCGIDYAGPILTRASGSLA